MKMILITLLMTGLTWAQELIEFQLNGPKDKRINMLIVGDGYLSSQRDKFIADMQEVVDAINSDPMLARYAKYHNYYGMFKASFEEGADADGGCGTADKNTAYDAKYCTSNVDRLLTVNGSKVNADAFSVLPELDQVMVIVNSTRYGGSGGGIAVSSISSPQIIAHEIGHSFPDLHDEYESAYSITPRATQNVTDQTTHANIHWNHWILESTPLPTPEVSTNGDLVGAFEGAAYQPTGWYRPQYNCRMRSNGVDLCAVCAEIWVLKIYEYLSPLEATTPAQGSLSDPQSLSLELMEVSGGEPLSVKWFVDQVEQVSNRGASTFDLNLPQGNYTISAEVHDTTQFVRKDPSLLLKDVATWDVTISANGTASLQVHNFAKTVVHAHRDGLSWRGAEQAQMRLLQVDGSIIADFTVDGSGASPWPTSLHTGSYVLKVQDSQGVRKIKFHVQ